MIKKHHDFKFQNNNNNSSNPKSKQIQKNHFKTSQPKHNNNSNSNNNSYVSHMKCGCDDTNKTHKDNNQNEDDNHSFHNSRNNNNHQQQQYQQDLKKILKIEINHSHKNITDINDNNNECENQKQNDNDNDNDYENNNSSNHHSHWEYLLKSPNTPHESNLTSHHFDNDCYIIQDYNNDLTIESTTTHCNNHCCKQQLQEKQAAQSQLQQPYSFYQNLRRKSKEDIINEQEKQNMIQKNHTNTIYNTNNKYNKAAYNLQNDKQPQILIAADCCVFSNQKDTLLNKDTDDTDNDNDDMYVQNIANQICQKNSENNKQQYPSEKHKKNNFNKMHDNIYDKSNDDRRVYICNDNKSSQNNITMLHYAYTQPPPSPAIGVSPTHNTSIPPIATNNHSSIRQQKKTQNAPFYLLKQQPSMQLKKHRHSTNKNEICLLHRSKSQGFILNSTKNKNMETQQIQQQKQCTKYAKKAMLIQQETWQGIQKRRKSVDSCLRQGIQTEIPTQTQTQTERSQKVQCMDTANITKKNIKNNNNHNANTLSFEYQNMHGLQKSTTNEDSCDCYNLNDSMFVSPQSIESSCFSDQTMDPYCYGNTYATKQEKLKATPEHNNYQHMHQQQQQQSQQQQQQEWVGKRLSETYSLETEIPGKQRVLSLPPLPPLSRNSSVASIPPLYKVL